MSATAIQPLFDLFTTERRGNAESQLEDWIGEVWADLLRSGSAECPVCHGQMERAAERGQCTRCGSELS